MLLNLSYPMLFSVALGGAVGAVGRFALSQWVASRSDSLLPLGTLYVNALGAFFIGVLVVVLDEKLALPDYWRAMLIVGLLGSLTTFSTFSLELLNLLTTGHWIYATLYLIVSVVLCVALVALGMSAARLF